MKTGMIISAAMHVIVVLAMIFGLPFAWTPKVMQETPILVELVKLGDITRSQKPPEPKKKPAPPKPKKKPKPKKEAAKPPPPPAAPKQQAPPKQSELAPPKPKVKKKPVVEKKPPPPKAKFTAAPKPPTKPKRQRRFDSSRIAALLDKTEKKRDIPLREKLAKLKESAPSPPQPSNDLPLTMTEIDAIRYQIEQCWSVPGGARDAADLIVRIKVFLKPDGSLAQMPQIVDAGGRMSEPFYRAAAESARRAVQQCTPLQKLPVDKYESWREITLTFDPRQMVEG